MLFMADQSSLSSILYLQVTNIWGNTVKIRDLGVVLMAVVILEYGIKKEIIF